MKILLAFLFLFPVLKTNLIDLKPIEEKSYVQFDIDNFGITTHGSLSGFAGKIQWDEANPSNSKFDISVQVSSINTENSRRDKSLRSDEFFDAEKYPFIKLVSTSIQSTRKKGVYKFNGNLSLKNVTKPISFLFNSSATSISTAFSGSFKINRRDYGVGESSMTLSDNVVVEIYTVAQ